MVTTISVKERVPTMMMHDVLGLYIPPSLRGRKYEAAMNELWGDWGVCIGCQTTIVLGAPVLWRGEGFVHAGHIKNSDAVTWSKVTLPGRKGSVADRLRRKKEREEASEAA